MTLTAFISYKSEYRDFAQRLRDSLRAWGLATWLDVDNIPSGNYFRDAIQQGLETSGLVVGVVTPEALQSYEVKTEWDFAIRYKRRLLLLICAPVQLPYWLSGIQYIDFTRQEEAAALAQLQQALRETDSSHYQDSPAEAQRSVVASASPTVDPVPPPALRFFERQSAEQRAEHNYQQLIYNVYQSWIVGVLRENLQDNVLEIGVGLEPQAVLRHVEYGDYRLPTSRKIGQIFLDMGGQLLILGKPGSGKTILLLQLAEQLLTQVQADTSQPIPVILNLSSWATKANSLEAWLFEALYLSYGIPREISAQWLAADKLCLLLDGLDEVTQEKRAECVEAINVYQHQYPKTRLAVCSRVADYEVLQVQLDMHGAILLNDISPTQISSYLTEDPYIGLRDLIQSETSAAKLAQTPFLLNIMKTTYANMAYDGSPHNRLKLDESSEAIRARHLFNRYVDQQLRTHSSPDYSPKKTQHYLTWLARQMAHEKLSVFYIEDIQPRYLKTRREQVRYYVIAALSTVCLAGLIGGLSVVPVGGLGFGLAVGLIEILVLGFLGGLRLRLGKKPRRLNNGGDDIEFIELISWSLRSKNIVRGFLIGVVGGLIFGLIFGFGEMTRWLNFGLVGALIGASVGLSIGGLKRSSSLQGRSHPNAGLQQNRINIIRLGLFFGLSIGLSIWLLVGLLYGWSGGLIGGLVLGVSVGLMAGPIGGFSLGGGIPLIQHITLRILLIRADSIPDGRYDHFLDYATEAGLLRKAGGGYIFRHRMLLEYFAEQTEKVNT